MVNNPLTKSYNGYYWIRMGTHGRPITCHNPLYRLIIGKDRTRLFIFSVHLSTAHLSSTGHVVSPCSRRPTPFARFFHYLPSWWINSVLRRRSNRPIIGMSCYWCFGCMSRDPMSTNGVCLFVNSWYIGVTPLWPQFMDRKTALCGASFRVKKRAVYDVYYVTKDNLWHVRVFRNYIQRQNYRPTWISTRSWTQAY